MINILKDGIACINIVAEQTPIAIYAAKELQDYLLRISGCNIPICNDAKGRKSTIFIGDTEWCKSNIGSDDYFEEIKYDGFYITSRDDSLIITSKVERGLLYAIYSLLEIIGCKWFYPGENGEYIPSLNNISLGELCILENPDFEIRSFVDGTHKEPINIWKFEILELIDWCCKNRINSIFIHQEPYKELDGIDLVINEMKKRDMIFEFGGHGVQNFVDRNLFDKKQYLFREINGERRKDGNFCSSSEEAIRYCVEGVKRVLDLNPGIDILHLYFDDVMEGSWCACELCKDMTPAQQAMNVINKIGSEISGEYPNIKLSMVLYHDTFDAKEITSSPGDNIIAYFAPRERCYSHSIGDGSCGRNIYYYERLKDALDKFGSNTYIFEYYDDMILFRKMKINIPEVIVKDLMDYYDAGVRKITSLMFGRYSWWVYEFNMYVFAKAVWSIGYDHSKGLSEFCEKLFPSIYIEMIEYYKMLEDASRLLLTFCGYKGYLQDLRDIPPQDFDFYQQHIEQIKNSIVILEDAMLLIKGLMDKCSDERKIRLTREKYILDITIREVNAIYNEMFGRLKHVKGGCKDKKILGQYFEKSACYISEGKEIIKEIPFSVKGNAGGYSLFVNHLCSDHKNFLDSLKK